MWNNANDGYSIWILLDSVTNMSESQWITATSEKYELLDRETIIVKERLKVVFYDQCCFHYFNVIILNNSR